MSAIKYSKYCEKITSNIPYYNEFSVNIKNKFAKEGCNQLISYPNEKVYDFDAYIKSKYSEHGTPPQSMENQEILPKNKESKISMRSDE